MRSLLLLLILFPFILSPAQGQAPSEDSIPILVLKNSWAKFRYRPGWDSQPLPNQAGTLSRAPNTVSNPNRRRLPRVIEGYAYKATLRNIGQKSVVSIGWDYTFTDSESKKVTHHEFYSRIKIKPGEKKEVRKYVKEPPTRTIRASGAGKEMIEEVRIKYIEFGDGSRWSEAKKQE